MFSGLYVKLIAAGLGLVAVLGTMWYVSNLQNQVQTLQHANTVLVDQGNVLAAKIVEQNNAVDAMKAEATARERAGAIAIAAAKAETAKAKKKATVIYKTPPSTPGDKCKSSLDLINGVTP